MGKSRKRPAWPATPTARTPLAISAGTSPRELVDRYFAMTLPSLYHDEKAREDLDGIYGIWARLDKLLWAIRDLLSTLPDPESCEALFLDHLGTVVGLDERVPWFAQLGEDAKRRAIRFALEFWATKGTGYKAIVRSIVGAKCLCLDWFSLRSIVGGTLPLVVLEEPGEGAERQSWIHYVDRDAAGYSFVENVIQSVRTLGREVVHHETYFLDDFLEGAGLWDVSPAGLASVIEDGSFRIGDASQEVTATERSTIAASYCLWLRGSFEDGSVWFRTCIDHGGNGYELEVSKAGEVGTFTLTDSDGGAVLASGSGRLYDGCVHDLRIQHLRVTGGTEVQVLLDGGPVLAYTPGASTYDPAGFSIRVSVGGGYTLRTVEMVPNS